VQPEATPEEELVSKLKKIRSNSGPVGAGHLTKAMQMLTKARKGGVCDITAYNIIIRVSVHDGVGKRSGADSDMHAVSGFSDRGSVVLWTRTGPWLLPCCCSVEPSPAV